MEQNESLLIRSFFQRACLLELMNRCFAGFHTNLSEISQEELLNVILHPGALANLGHDDFINHQPTTDVIQMGIIVPVDGFTGNFGTFH